ncbi:MAG TPA: asparagine synthase (glutamine-hydrolyzing) [Methylocystis sp.]|nr:asparagine synthase (glutamine-hydrolyzing) [Methylocystis sp.]
MCGIAGILSKHLAPGAQLEAPIGAMTSALYRRGPDAGATFVDAEPGVALGHRRLAILDLSERGAQPMRSACGRYVIVFNGEIYNHLELRRELETRRPVAWRGTSDTETLLECFVELGVSETLRKSVGMFALALWDRRDRRLTLARDRFGEKPLYYGFIGRGDETAFVFGSELKALRAHPAFDNPIDSVAVNLFLQYCYVPTPRSIYENVFKLEPGTILSLGPQDVAARERRVERYWDYQAVILAGLSAPILDEREALDRLESTLSDAVALQLVADVPVGAFLSGGIDSSTIVALMQARSSRPTKTFTIGFDEAGFDEAPHAREVARHLKTDHHEIRVTPEETRAIVPRLPETYDEPFADSSQIPTSIVCAIARRSVTVALSGDAGDELLGGYNRYVLGPSLWRRLAPIPAPLRAAMGAAIGRLPSSAWDAALRLPGLGGKLASFKDKAYKLAPSLGDMRCADDMYHALATEWRWQDAPTLGESSAPRRSETPRLDPRIHTSVERMMAFDALTYLPDDILTKVDRAAMSVSLETRVPLLDHRVAELAWRLPQSMKIRDGAGKWALRQILYRHVPRELVERPKAGFAIPIGAWLRGPLRGWADELLSESSLRAGGHLKVETVRRLWLEHRSGRRDWTMRLWNLLMFQAWLAAQSRSSDWPAPPAERQLHFNR